MHLEKNSFFQKNGAKWTPAGSRNPPKIYKISNKIIEALLTNTSEKQLETVSLQSPPGPLKSSKFIVECVKNGRSPNCTFLALRCLS